MVPEKYRLAAVGRFLIDAFERRRPGLSAWGPEVETALLAEAEVELLQMEKQCLELGVDDPPYWQKLRGAITAILLPRYAQLARAELALARREYDLWRGGDLLARLAYAGSGLVIGGLMVAIPWIPVYEKWVPWALFVLGPFIPDAQLWWYRRRHQKRLDAVVADLAKADASLELYRPLSELQRTFGEPFSIPSPETPVAREPLAAPEPPAPAAPPSEEVPAPGASLGQRSRTQ